MAKLQINTPNYFIDVDDVPVRIEIRDASLDLVESTFVRFGQPKEVTVEPGMYVVEADLPSGQRTSKVVSVDEAQDAVVDLDTADLSPHESHAWAYLNKNAARVPDRLLSQARYEGAWVRLWRKDDHGWETANSEFDDNTTWESDGVNYRLDSFGGLQFLQVGGPDIPWKLVALPGAQQLRVLIRAAIGPAEQVHPLDVIVSTHNAGAEAILSLLTSGAVDQAREFETAGAAELLLYGKMADPIGAAIGGYYLLKTDDLNRLHNWTLNLADWIDWMPDGPIIRAWHVLKDARLQGKDRDQTRATARKFLLEAVERGVPIYTEGLRLLRDGLNILSHDRNDGEVRAAKAIVDTYTQACDWTAPTTTFLGLSPDEPDSKPVFGKPDSMQDLVFLFNVDTPELIRQGVVTAGSTLSLERFEKEPVKVIVESGGELNLDGKLYKSLQEVAESVGEGESQYYAWRSDDSGESISEGVEYLRRGKLAVYEK